MKLKRTNKIVIISLAIFSLQLPYSFTIGTNLNFEYEKLWYLFFLSLSIITPLSLWYFTLTQFKELRIEKNILHVKNIITRKENQINFNEKIEFKNIDKPNKLLIIISKEYKLMINRELYYNRETFITELKTLANNTYKK